MTDGDPIVIDYAGGRDVTLDCDHGTICASDAGPLWSEGQLTDFARVVLSARARCTCFGPRGWFPPAPPGHVSIDCRVYEVDQPDPDVDHVRPRAIPGPVVSAAANRVFETGTPSADHSLDADWGLVRLWWRRRQLGLLDDD